MRCPDCKHNQRYRDGMRCGKCGYHFMLRKQNHGISDYALRQIIQRLSDNGQHAFTITQLALELCRYWRRNITGLLIGGLILAAIAAMALRFLTDRWSIALIAFAALTLWAIWTNRRKKVRLPFAKARQLIERYHQAHPIDALADGRAFLSQTTPEESHDPHYAPERILVVERDDLVDMLIRNRFHAAHKTAVISRSGYPAPVVEACKTFLRRHPNLPVQLLHDASLQGFNLRAQLMADPRWPLAGRPLIDLGLSRDILQNTAKLPWLKVGGRGQGLLSADHEKMLNAGRRVPVDCMGPKPFLNLMGAAVIGGMLLLPAPSATGEVACEFGVEVDDFG